MNGVKYSGKKKCRNNTGIRLRKAWINMWKKRKLVYSFAAVILVFAILTTGCGDKKDFFTEYGITLPASGISYDSSKYYSQDYLSGNVCVIPVSEQDKENSSLPADAALLINSDTDEVVYSQNIYKRLYPASVTKIVTTLLVLKYGNLDDIVTISYNASHITEYGAKLCGFEEGDQIKLKKLLYAFMVYSGNDAGIAIAEHISGSEEEFVKLMNKEMTGLGAAGSHFTNSHGLHNDNHYTTAYDLYLVFNKLVSDYPLFNDIIKQGSVKAKYKSADGTKKEMIFTSTVKYKLNTETAPEGVKVTGGKTGTTQMAGSNLILYSTGPDGNNYISVIMHASDVYSLYDQMNYLLGLEGKSKEE